MRDDLPRRRHRLKLDLEADSLGELAVALQHIGFLAERGELTKGYSAGYNSSYDYEFDSDENVTEESYRAAVAEFVKRKRAGG